MAIGEAWLAEEGIMHGRPILSGYARVNTDRIMDKKYNMIH